MQMPCLELNHMNLEGCFCQSRQGDGVGIGSAQLPVPSTAKKII